MDNGIDRGWVGTGIEDNRTVKPLFKVFRPKCSHCDFRLEFIAPSNYQESDVTFTCPSCQAEGKSWAKDKDHAEEM